MLWFQMNNGRFQQLTTVFISRHEENGATSLGHFPGRLQAERTDKELVHLGYACIIEANISHETVLAGWGEERRRYSAHAPQYNRSAGGDMALVGAQSVWELSCLHTE